MPLERRFAQDAGDGEEEQHVERGGLGGEEGEGGGAKAAGMGGGSRVDAPYTLRFWIEKCPGPAWVNTTGKRSPLSRTSHRSPES